MTNERAINLLRGQENAYWDTLSEAEHKAYDKAVEALEAAPAKWISVKKRPPKIGENVLILSRYGHISDAKFEHYMGEFYFDPFGYELSDGYVTHWMPRPEEPGEGEP